MEWFLSGSGDGIPTDQDEFDKAANAAYNFGLFWEVCVETTPQIIVSAVNHDMLGHDSQDGLFIAQVVCSSAMALRGGTDFGIAILNKGNLQEAMAAANARKWRMNTDAASFWNYLSFLSQAVGVSTTAGGGPSEPVDDV